MHDNCLEFKGQLKTTLVSAHCGILSAACLGTTGHARRAGGAELFVSQLFAVEWGVQ